MWEYTDKVKEHFLNPRNVGDMEDADAVGEVGSMACGDALKLMIKLDGNERITDAKFQTFGCASAIASSSALTEMIIGKTLEEAEQITNDHIAEYLGGLPKEKMHCSVMGRDALERAIACYRGDPEKEVEGEVICECFGVTDIQIERAVTENHLTSIEDVTDFVKAGGGCGNCHDNIQDIIDRVLGKGPRLKKKPAALTNIQKIKLIEDALSREVRPELKKDGGDIELIDVDGNRVLVALRGRCATCTASEVTLKHYVESKLRELVTPELVVEEVSS
ncbi:Iron-sulfur cluster assembly scaffold protein NifU [Olavius algarvensis associated proteobacterium Delta 3]|nr:Iron-sulfur cluster assembly scaffold protein NifU [Olavius algarvensis associated proteobacterium Delta 3]